jgi:hypothetical protein
LNFHLHPDGPANYSGSYTTIGKYAISNIVVTTGTRKEVDLRDACQTIHSYLKYKQLHP